MAGQTTKGIGKLTYFGHAVQKEWLKFRRRGAQKRCQEPIVRSTFRAIWLLVPDTFSVPGQSTRRDDLNTGRTARTRRVGTSAEVVSVLSLAVNMRPGSQRGLVCKSDTKICLFRRIQQLLCRICQPPPDRIQYIGKNCCRATKSRSVCCQGDWHAAPSVF